MTNNILEQAPLGKTTSYISTYTPSLLFPVPRIEQRREMGLANDLIFHGADLWNAYEFSWLNSRGKPIVMALQFNFPAQSKNILESKSLKLYLNSFSDTQFESHEQVLQSLQKDLNQATGGIVGITSLSLRELDAQPPLNWQGICLDDLDISINTYTTTPEFLLCEDQVVNETLYTHLLKSNCPVTGQPDWGSVLIRYQGKKINHEGLLKYIISFRNHDEFAEHCTERVFMDVSRLCQPEKLTVHVRYTRRGGLDINPWRSNFENVVGMGRFARQ